MPYCKKCSANPTSGELKVKEEQAQHGSMCTNFCHFSYISNTTACSLYEKHPAGV